MTRGFGRLQSIGDPSKRKIGEHWFSLENMSSTKKEATENKDYLKMKGVKYIRILKSGNHYVTYVR